MPARFTAALNLPLFLPLFPPLFVRSTRWACWAPLMLACVTVGVVGCASSHPLELTPVDGGVDQGDAGDTRDADVPDVGRADTGLVDSGGRDIGFDAGRECPDLFARPAFDPTPGAPPIILPPDGPCRTSSDCFGGTSCVGASDPHCGICPTPVRECEDDSGCAGSDWCRASAPSCCGGVDTQCVPSCVTQPSVCQGGEICDAATGRCENNSCLFLDFACPANHDCDPAAPNADTTGCVRRSCADDAACDCGFCVTGTCESQLGTCMLPAP